MRTRKRASIGLMADIAQLFLKMGFITVGGGFSMIPLIRQEMIEKRGWLDEDKLVEILAVAQSLPGSLTINSSILIGYEVARVPGALSAVTGAAFPPFFTITVIAAFFNRFQGNPVVDAAFLGVRCAVVALIWNAGFGIAKSVVRDPLSRTILGLTLIVMMFSSVNPALFVLFLALLGVSAMLFRSWKEKHLNKTVESHETDKTNTKKAFYGSGREARSK